MGTIRESCDPNMRFPSSIFFGSDLPKNSHILIDDISEHIILMQVDNGIKDWKFYSFDFIDELKRTAVLACAKGRQLKINRLCKIIGHKMYFDSTSVAGSSSCRRFGCDYKEPEIKWSRGE